jgi:hypothetical protein
MGFAPNYATPLTRAMDRDGESAILGDHPLEPWLTGATRGMIRPP